MNQGSWGRARISVFLLDDYESVRRDVRHLLTAEPDIEVIGEAGTMASALEQLPTLRPDVAVLGAGCRTATAYRSAVKSAPPCPARPA